MNVAAIALVACSRPAEPVRIPPAAARITQFYASPPNPPKGQAAKLCYGVESASQVLLDPPVEKVWPALSRCFEVRVDRPTSFTLTAEGPGGKEQKTVTISPGPPAVELIELQVSQLEIRPGESISICYAARNAVSGKIEPGVYFGERTPLRTCIKDSPKKTTEYTAIVQGAAGDTDSERVTVKVR